MNERYKPLFEHFETVMSHRNYFVFDNHHSVDRYNEKVKLPIEIYKAVLIKAIDWVIANKKENVHDQYVFISKKFGFGIQIEWREDEKKKLPGMNGYTSTTLSKNEMNYFTRNDKKVFLENIRENGYSENESRNIFEKGYTRFQFEGELKEELNLIYVDKFVQSGEIHYTVEIVEV